MRKEHITTVKVRYSETDAMGVVYHANYLGWFDIARIEFLSHVGYPYDKCEEDGFFCPVLEAHINYGKPFKFGEEAKVVLTISKATPVKATYSYEVYGIDDDPATATPRLTGHTIHCLVDKNTFKPLAIKKAYPGLYNVYKEWADSCKEEC